MRWVVRSGSRRMARNALRLEAQDFMREFQTISRYSRSASSSTPCQIERRSPAPGRFEAVTKLFHGNSPVSQRVRVLSIVVG